MIETIDLPKYVSSTATVREILSSTSAEYLLFNISGREVNLTDESLARMLDAAKAAGAGMVYSDYIKMTGPD